MSSKRAFFGTFWCGGLGAVGRCLSIASSLQELGFSCYFFAEGVTECFIRKAGFISIRPPYIPEPKVHHFPYVSPQRIVSVGAVFSNLDEFYAMRGYHDAEYVDRAFQIRFKTIEGINPDILFGYWSWETTIAARILKKPLVNIIQRSLHPAGSGFANLSSSTRHISSIESFNSLLTKLNLRKIKAVEELMIGDVTLISGVPITDPLPVDEKLRYCGPILWSDGGGTKQLETIPGNQKVAWVYATDLDSWVGGHFILRKIVPILTDMGFFVLISSGGYPVPVVDNPKVLRIKYVPGSIAAQRADLVVGRGGHDLFWTAIMASRPFFGAPPNSEWLDYCKYAQLLGVGDYIEEKNFSGPKVISKIENLVTSLSVTLKIGELRKDAMENASRSAPLNVLREFWPQLFQAQNV